MWAVFISFLVALFFSGCGSWFIVPFSFQPSYWEFKKLCELDPEIYQARGGKFDEEYYNKMLTYYELDWDTMLNTITPYQYKRNGVPIPNDFNYMLDEKWLNDRLIVNLSFDITKDSFGNVIKVRPYWRVTWRDLRPTLEGNEGSGFSFGGGRIGCFSFYDKYGIERN
ncbi:hypothetical protein [Helicobacter sp. T3_23-1056]